MARPTQNKQQSNPAPSIVVLGSHMQRRPVTDYPCWQVRTQKQYIRKRYQEMLVRCRASDHLAEQHKFQFAHAGCNRLPSASAELILTPYTCKNLWSKFDALATGSKLGHGI